jgi:hypothetical protein
MAVAAVPAAVWAAPSISSFTPTQAPLGAIVTISGSGFTGARSVTFGGVTATFKILSDASIQATVPTFAITGKITAGAATSASTFHVLPGIALSPAVGPPTSAITVAGSGFGANELVDIYESTTDVVLAVTDVAGRISGIPLTIPSWAPPGALWISAVGRHSQLAAQKAFTVRTDWPNPRRNAAGSGRNPFENVLNTSSVLQLEMAWTTTGGNFLSNGPPGVIVASGLIVAPLPIFNQVVALHTNGSQAWSQALTSSYFSAPGPAEGGGIVVVPSTDGKLHAYTLSTGAPVWTTPGPNDTGNGSAVVAGSVVFAPGATTLQAFNLNTGALQWSYTGPCTGNLSTPAVSAGTILFTCTDSGGSGFLVTLGTNGTFYHYFSPGTGTTSAPAIVGGNAYLLLAGNFVGFSLSGFNPKWSVAPPFSVSTNLAAGDGIVVTCGSGGIWALSAFDGSTRFSNSSYSCSASPTIADGVIYEPRNGDVAMFDEYGDPLGRLGTGGNIGPVSVVNGAVYGADSISGVDSWSIPAAASGIHRAGARPDVWWQLHPNWTLKPHPSASLTH